MFGKILRAGKSGHGVKYKIDVQVVTAENLPNTVKKCRVVWARSAKVQMTDAKDVRGSEAIFKQTLTQVTTIYRDKSGKMDAKEYEFKVQEMGKSSSDTPVTIGKATVDIANYCKEETNTQTVMVPITFKKSGGTTTGYVRLLITSIFLGDATEDGQTEVSGMTGLTSDHGSVREQDLEGFVEDDHSKFSKRAKSKREDSSSATASTSGRSSKAETSRWHKPLPPTAEEDASDLEDEHLQEPLTKAKSSRRKSQQARQPPEAEDDEAGANPFAKRVSKPPVRRPPPKVFDDDDDVSPMNSDISDTDSPAPVTKTKASSKLKEPEESFDELKASLLSTKKSNNVAGRGPAAPADAAAAGSSKATSSRAGKALASVPIEDEDTLRNDLFNVKPRSSGAASAGKAAATSKAVAAASAAAVADAPSRHRSKPEPSLEDEEEEDAGYGPSTSAVPATVSKARGRAADAPEASSKGYGASAKAGSAKPDSAKAPSGVEMEQLRQRIAQLEEQLADELAAKDELSKKMQKYVDKVADLEDQLAEGDITELYTQMKEMELKHFTEIKEMESKYQAEIKDLMERHLAEVEELEERHQTDLADLQVANSGRGTDSASVDELKRLQDDLREQEALLKPRIAKLEAEQVSTNLARQAAEVKLAEANKMLDDSLLMATKHQQENKGLQEEVSRLKRRLEDASMWDTSAAVAAVTASAKRDDDEELDELRAKLQELQEDNARLQRLGAGRSRGLRMSETDEAYKKRIEELQAANRKLEAVCGDLEEKSHAAEHRAEKLLADVEGLRRKICELEASAAASQKWFEGEVVGGRQSENVTDLETRVTRMTREKTALEGQLADERAARQELEDALKDKLDRAGDDEAAETVAAFEVKYNRLKERYKMLEESSQEELDELQDQLTEAVAQVNDLQRQVKQLQSQLNQSRAAAGAAVPSGANAEELRNLRSENERLVQQLVAKTMELAEMSEREITIKRELARVREINMKIAQKATTLEAQVATTQAVAKPAKGGKK